MAIQPTSASDLDKVTAESLQSEGGLFEMRRLAQALAARKIEGLRLYEPMMIQQHFHMSRTRERVVRGSNRSGKTLSAAVEIATAVCGEDKFNRYPKENGVCYCVGFDGKHLADPMWKKLSKAGAFKMIRDLGTMKWRSFRPWIPSDKERENEAKPAPPLIPPRMIEFIAWEIKKTNQPSMVKLVNGWEIHFYSGNAKPPQGSQCDLAWFDEEIADSEWYPEIAFRLFDRNGYFIWSATPQAGTDRLFNLHERAEREQEANRQPRTVEEFVLLLENNIHATEEQKAAIAEKLDDDDKDVRIGGDFSRIYRIFPEYNSKDHGIPWRPIPADWTRYVSIDPGRQVCAALFLAVPPPTHDLGQHIFLYDEIYIRECDAVQFGHAMKLKCAGQEFREFFIDPHEAPKHDTGSGKTIEEQYRDQLRLNGVRSIVNGFGFTYGNMDVAAGIEAIRSWFRRIGVKQLKIENRGEEKYNAEAKYFNRYSALRVIEEKCPNFVWEIKRYRHKVVKGIPTDKPEQKNNHLMDCLRYLRQADPVWVAPSHRGGADPPVYTAFKKFMKSQNQGGTGIHLGPGNSFK